MKTTPAYNTYKVLNELLRKKKNIKKKPTVVCLAHTGGCTHVALALMRVWVRNYQIIFPASDIGADML